MTRVALVGCMALAALGAVTVLEAGSATAEAAPSVSPFAGTYVWYTRVVQISSGGRISGSSGSPSSIAWSISGRVNADGSYEFKFTESYPKDPRNGEDGHKDTSVFAGTMTLDADGNVVGTFGSAGSFVWLRQ